MFTKSVTLQRYSLSEKNLTRFAWREYKDAKAYAEEHLVGGPPKWFREGELGFEPGGHTLRWTCEQLAKQNEAAIRVLGHQAPRHVTYPIGHDYERARRTPVKPKAKKPRRGRAA